MMGRRPEEGIVSKRSTRLQLQRAKVTTNASLASVQKDQDVVANDGGAIPSENVNTVAVAGGSTTSAKKRLQDTAAANAKKRLQDTAAANAKRQQRVTVPDHESVTEKLPRFRDRERIIHDSDIETDEKVGDNEKDECGNNDDNVNDEGRDKNANKNDEGSEKNVNENDKGGDKVSDENQDESMKTDDVNIEGNEFNDRKEKALCDEEDDSNAEHDEEDDSNEDVEESCNDDDPSYVDESNENSDEENNSPSIDCLPTNQSTAAPPPQSTLVEGSTVAGLPNSSSDVHQINVYDPSIDLLLGVGDINDEALQNQDHHIGAMNHVHQIDVYQPFYALDHPPINGNAAPPNTSIATNEHMANVYHSESALGVTQFGSGTNESAHAVAHDAAWYCHKLNDINDNITGIFTLIQNELESLQNICKMQMFLERMVEKLSEKQDRMMEMLLGGTATAGVCLAGGGGGNAVAVGGTTVPTRGATLTHPNLIQLNTAIERLPEPVDVNQRKFHRAFVSKYKDLLMYYQVKNHSNVLLREDKVLHEFVKNQKTNLRLELEGKGPLAKDARYKPFLRYLGIVYKPT